MSHRTGRRERGGMLSLLLTLLAIGALAYFMLHGRGGGGSTELGSGASAISCEQRISKLVSSTGGQGPAYKAGYEALPSSCRGLLPAPGALEPSPKAVEPEG